MSNWSNEGAKPLPWVVIWIGLILSAAFFFLALKNPELVDPIPAPSTGVGTESGIESQNGVWNRIPDHCEVEGLQQADCLNGLTTQERDAITCAQEDGPGPCFWLGKADGKLYFVPKE